MHLLVVRRMARRAVAEATPLAQCRRETDEVTLRRAAQITGLRAAGMVVIVLVVGLWGGPGLPFASGAFLGDGRQYVRDEPLAQSLGGGALDVGSPSAPLQVAARPAKWPPRWGPHGSRDFFLVPRA